MYLNYPSKSGKEVEFAFANYENTTIGPILFSFGPILAITPTEGVSHNNEVKLGAWSQGHPHRGTKDKVVTVRMNRDFMEFMRANYPDVIKSTHPKYGSIITADDVKEERARAQEQEVDMFD